MLRILAPAVLAFTTSSGSAEQLAVAAWNVESFHFFSTCAEIASNGRCAERTAAGSSAALTAISLRDDFEDIDLFALTEVAGEEEAEAFAIVADDDENTDYRYFIGNSGGNLRVAVVFSSDRLELLGSVELDFASTDGNSRRPLAGHFRLRESGEEFWAVAVHLTRGQTRSDGSGSGDIRNDAQARELRNWIEEQSVPVIALGDFNFDVNYQTGRERIGFHSFVDDEGPIWVRPENDVDTNWSGSDSDAYPNSILDFVFLSQDATDWQRVGYAYVRENDFPDTWRTADHRPVVAIFETDPTVAFAPEVTDFLPSMVTTTVATMSRNAGQPSTIATEVIPEVAEMLSISIGLQDRSVDAFRAASEGSDDQLQIFLQQFRQEGFIIPGPRLIEERN